jgi:hypothetical protein
MFSKCIGRAAGCYGQPLEGLCETQIPPVSPGDVALAIPIKHIAYSATFKLYTLVLFQLSHHSTPSYLLLGFVYCMSTRSSTLYGSTGGTCTLLLMLPVWPPRYIGISVVLGSRTS